MAKKTFKIGEYAIGGIITVNIEPKVITIKALDWNTKKCISGQRFPNEPDLKRSINNYLNDLTSGYYAGKILDFIFRPVKTN